MLKKGSEGRVAEQHDRDCRFQAIISNSRQTGPEGGMPRSNAQRQLAHRFSCHAQDVVQRVAVPVHVQHGGEAAA